jgi:hypothetical protein
MHNDCSEGRPSTRHESHVAFTCNPSDRSLAAAHQRRHLLKHLQPARTGMSTTTTQKDTPADVKRVAQHLQATPQTRLQQVRTSSERPRMQGTLAYRVLSAVTDAAR